MGRSAKPRVRKVGVEEALRVAIDHQRNGRLDEAGELLARVLELVPRHPKALHYAGVLEHQRGKTARGLELINASLALAPREADFHTNRGNLLKALGRIDEAREAYEQAIVLNPRDVNAHANLGAVLRAQEDPAGAESAYRRALELDPENANAYRSLGLLLSSKHRHEEAIDCFIRYLELASDDVAVRRRLAMAFCAIGDQAKAVALCEEWIREDPEDDEARHMLAAISGRDVPARAADGYVEGTFDAFAPNFDAHLAKLAYRAPQLIGAMLADLGLQQTRALEVVDLGCGTGLCGPLLSPYARRLVGVDLSGKMLDGARARGGYDELVKAELTEFLQGLPAGACDLAVSADTLCYFGELDAVASAAARALKPGARLIFTLEKARTGAAERGYVLEPHGRYSHDAGYVQRTLAAAGFEVSIIEAELRLEGGQPVGGYVIAASLPDMPSLRDAAQARPIDARASAPGIAP